MIEANRDWRKQFVEDVGYCMLCSSRGSLCVHEMCPGSRRAESYSRRELCLVVCAFCNGAKLPGMPLAQQLVFKLLGDRWWFDLDAIREVKDNGRKPVVVTMSDVRQAKETMGI